MVKSVFRTFYHFVTLMTITISVGPIASRKMHAEHILHEHTGAEQKTYPRNGCVFALSTKTSSSAMAEGPRHALVSRNSATTKYPYRMALFV